MGNQLPPKICDSVLKACLPCDDDPIRNLSAEAADREIFVANVVDKFNWNLGDTFVQFWCKGICISEISQDDADLCAARNAAECVLDGGTGSTGSGSTPIMLFGNTQQSCTIPCPNGGTFTYTLPAGSIVRRTLEEANLVAASIACTLARAHRMCLGAFSTTCCIAQPFSGGITATGSFLAPTVFGFNFWQITSGSIPPGMTFHGGFTLSKTVVIDGTPTTAGTYSFSVRVTAPNGDHSERSYTLIVAGITNADPLPDATAGAAYSIQLNTFGFDATPNLQIGSGALPTGLSLVGDTISGTPTTAGTGSIFAICAIGNVDSVEQVCCKEFTILVLPVPLNHTPEAYYACEWTGAPRVDSTGNGHTLSISGSGGTPPEGSTTGLYGFGIEFGTTNNILYFVSSSALVNSSGEFTGCGWFKATSYVPGSLFGNNGGNSGRIVLGLRGNVANDIAAVYLQAWDDATGLVSDPHLQLRVKRSGQVDESIYIPWTPDLNWHFLSIWFDNTDKIVRCQVDNGTIYASSALTSKFTTPVVMNVSHFSSAPIFIGQGYDYEWDEQGWWSSVLSAAQRTAIYNGGVGRTWPNVP